MENIFTGLDLPEEVVTTLTERVNTEIQKIKEGAQNDPEFITKLRKEEAAKFFRSNERFIKKVFGIDADKIDTDKTGLDKQELILKMAKKSLEENKDQTNQELQDKLIAAKAEFSTYRDETVPGLLDNERTKYQSRFIKDAILKDSLEFETVCKPEVRPSLVNSFLQDKGWVKKWNDETNTYEILTKDNLKPTKDDKPLTKKEVIQLALDDAGVLKKSNGTTTTTGDTTTKRREPGKLSENAQAMLDSFQNAG